MALPVLQKEVLYLPPLLACHDHLSICLTLLCSRSAFRVCLAGCLVRLAVCLDEVSHFGCWQKLEVLKLEECNRLVELPALPKSVDAEMMQMYLPKHLKLPED